MNINKRLVGVLILLISLSVSVFAQSTIVVTPVLMPAQQSASWGIVADKVIVNSLEGTLAISNTVNSAQNPQDYTLCSGRIDWFNLVYSTGVAMWDGVLDPAYPFNNELGHVVWALVDARSMTGMDDISLSDLKVSFASNGGGALNVVTNYVNMDYSTRAIAIKANGTIVNSGPSDQKGNRILLLVQSKLFNGGGSQSGLDQDRNYIMGIVNQYGKYSLTFSAEINGDNLSSDSSTVIVLRPPAPPVLDIERDGSLGILNTEPGHSYQIYYVNKLGEQWKLLGMIGESSITLQIKSNSAQFFKAIAQ